MIDFMRATDQQIIDRFMSLPNAQGLICPTTTPGVFIPGSRPDKVLLVAHNDTVWRSGDASPYLNGTSIISRNPKVGIGADDRLGCLALWLLRNSGHSLLICPDEEIGCVGSGHIAQHYSDLLDGHQFAIQFDRRGSHDLVTYDCANPEFDKFLLKHYYCYEKKVGSYSDIAELCPALDIAGVNVSIGFYSEHTALELAEVYDFCRTLQLTNTMLKKKAPYFGYIEDESGWRYGWRNRQATNYTNTSWDDARDEWDDADDFDNQDNSRGKTVDYGDDETMWWCDDCARIWATKDMHAPETCPTCGVSCEYIGNKQEFK